MAARAADFPYDEDAVIFVVTYSEDSCGGQFVDEEDTPMTSCRLQKAMTALEAQSVQTRGIDSLRDEIHPLANAMTYDALLVRIVDLQPAMDELKKQGLGYAYAEQEWERDPFVIALTDAASSGATAFPKDAAAWIAVRRLAHQEVSSPDAKRPRSERGAFE